MIIGVPKEMKKLEFRVAMTAAGVREAIQHGHTVLIEQGAGIGSGIADAEFISAGAKLCTKIELFEKSDLIVKVKEPIPEEYSLFHKGQILFAYLHLAPDKEQTDALLAAQVTAFAYETLEIDGALPLLAPMSEIAGRMAPLMGAFFLQKRFGGTGVLPAGAMGTQPARCVILGAGVVGTNACRVAYGMGMHTTVLNNDAKQLYRIDDLYQGRIITLPLTATHIESEIADADIVIGAILVPGGRTPIFIQRATLARMKPGSVIVDVAVDQGGCVETTVPRTHDDPVYTVDGIQHYTVSNMPGAYPRTATFSLANATLPWILRLADHGPGTAIQNFPPLLKSLNLHAGKIHCEAVATAQEKTFVPYAL